MKLLFECISGSRAYNLDTPESDFDRRRVVSPESLSYFFGLDKFTVGNVITTKELDSVDYSLQQFIHLSQKCNTVTLECLFAPHDCITYVHPAFQTYFIDRKEEFITKELHHVVKGYAFSEYRRALGLTSKDVGERRKLDIETYGFSPKNASHCLRLLWAAKTALLTRQFPVRWYDDEREFLMDMKQGKLSKEQFTTSYDRAWAELESTQKQSTLPERNDQQFFSELLVEFYKEFFHI